MALGGEGDGHERAVDTVTPLDEEGEREGEGDATTAPLNDLEQSGMEGGSRILSRKEKRKAAKKMKRKQARKEIAAKVREEEEARLKDPAEQGRVELMERVEEERRELERKEFEERERAWIEAMERRKKLMEEEEEEERRKRELQVENGEEHNQDDDDDWEYVEEGPAEIIWQGNEIIVKKKTVRVPKKGLDVQRLKETNADDSDRPTSNPLPPQSEAFSDYQNSSTASAQQLLENVAQQVPNFGTEQDKAHCPFHLKTGACRFGQRCSRVHFYPDKSSTLLIRNMYTGPGLAWEQDEGLEYTDEEVERSYEEFYEDVHTEFLKFGEIINFKVCRNSSFHLRGNVYVHYKDLESAVLAYNSVNGRFFAGKQVKCEFVNVSRWKVAICGEYMKSRFKTCSRGSACNFIHCFRNPGGDYEWADWDKPPPKYWVSKMAALFGYPPEYSKEEQTDHSGRIRGSSKKISFDSKRHQPRRSASRERDYSSSRRSRKCHDEKNGIHRATSQKEYGGGQMDYDDERTCERKRNPKDRGHSHVRTFDDDDGAVDTDEERWHGDARKHSKRHKVYDSGGENGGLERTTKGPDHDGNKSDIGEDEEARYSHPRRSSKRHKTMKHEASTSKERSHRERNDDDYPRHSNSRSKRRSRSSDDDSRSYHDIHDRWDPEKQSQEDSDSRRNNEGS